MDHLPLHRMAWTFSPGTQQDFKLQFVNLEGPLQDTSAAIKLHIEGFVLPSLVTSHVIYQKTFVL